MSLFTRILVGVDDGDLSLRAVDLAARIARAQHGTVILANSVNWAPLVAEIESAGAPIDATPIVEGLRRRGTALLGDVALTLANRAIPVETRLVEGNPVTALLDAATSVRADMIVLGTHGRHGVDRLLQGSVTEDVLRSSVLPVLTLRSDTVVPSDAEPCCGRVLVGVDDSEPSDAAIATALELAATAPRELTFVSVIDIQRAISNGLVWADRRAELHAQAKRVVDEALRRAQGCGIAAVGRVVEGEVAAWLCTLGREVDLIVVGSHGRRGLRRWFLGSVAEELVRTAPVPVLVLRSLQPARGPELAAAGLQASAVGT